MYSWEKKLLRPKPAVSSIPSRTHKAYSTVQKMGTNGRSSCLECSGDITEARRKTFCCKSCSDSFYIKTRPDFARHEVFKRDKGVCAKCGLDVYAGLPEGRKRSRGTGHTSLHHGSAYDVHGQYYMVDGEVANPIVEPTAR